MVNGAPGFVGSKAEDLTPDPKTGLSHSKLCEHFYLK